jgi:hypothetical protein
MPKWLLICRPFSVTTAIFCIMNYPDDPESRAQTQQTVNFWTVETHYDFTANIQHRHSLLPAALDHIARGRCIPGDIHVFKRNALLAQVFFSRTAERTTGGGKNDHAWIFF